MSDHIDELVTEFGKALKLKALKFEKDKDLMIRDPELGTIILSKKNQDELLVCLGKHYELMFDSIYEDALSLCDFSYRYFFDVTAGLKGENMIVFCISLRDNRLQSSQLNQAFNLLKELHQKLAA